MVVNAEGGNETENGALPHSVIEDEDEDDPDKLMGMSAKEKSISARDNPLNHLYNGLR
jgi:hypothetical protein